MTKRDRHNEVTAPQPTISLGNELYHRAMFAIGMHGYAVTTALKSTLRAIGAEPETLSIEDLGAMLPEIERRLHLLAPQEEVKAAMGRLRHLMFEWFEEKDHGVSAVVAALDGLGLVELEIGEAGGEGERKEGGE